MEKEREELIYLIARFAVDHNLVLPCANIADYLLANGVTIQKWIPMVEGLPTSDDIPDYAEYDYHLVCCKSPINGKRTVRPALASYDGFADKCLLSCHGLTHWMPLPKPPKEE